MREKWAFKNRYLAATTLVATICAGCSSGTTSRLTPLAPGSGNALIPVTSLSLAAAPPTGLSHAKTARVTIRMASKTKHPGKRLPRYISPSTLGVGISAYMSGSAPPTIDQVFFDATPGSATCTSNPDGSRTCNFAVNAPVGTDDFRVDLYDAVPSGEGDSGKLLGTGYALSQIVNSSSTNTNTLNIVIDGIIASLATAPSTIVPIENGTTQQFPVAINLLDADNNYIVGLDPLKNPVTLSLSGDPNQTLSLSSKTIANGTGNRVTLTYKSGTLVNGLLTAKTTDGITASIPVQGFNVSPTTLNFSSTTPQTVTVSDAGYNSVFEAWSSDPNCATVSPHIGTPASQGSPVPFTVTPSATGACTIQIVGRAGISIPVSTTLADITLPGTPHWLIYPRYESLSVSEPGFTGTFAAVVSGSACVKPSPATQAAVNGTAAFTITAVAAGTCTVTVTGSQLHAFSYTVYRDNWTMFGHDLQRTGNQSDPGVTLTKATVGSLKLRWSKFIGSSVVGQALVVDGRIYVAEYNGTVASIDAKTGSTVWSIKPFGAAARIAMSPSYDNGTIFVGQHMPEGASVGFDAIGADTGKIKWSSSLPGGIRGSPAVVNGTVFIGTADGDPAPYGTCMQGGVFALNEANGAIVWHYVVDQAASDGGSVWSPISYDGSKLIFGTGNTCSATPIDDASNSVVALSPQTGGVIWVSNILEPQTNDNDDGAGGALWRGTFYTQSKNGNFYIINATTGLVQAKIPDGLSNYAGATTPVTDGQHVIVSSGYRVPLTLLPAGSDGGFLYGYDMRGHQDWEVATSDYPVYEMSMTNGILLAGMDHQLNALDASTGAQLWSYPFTIANDHMYSPPVVTPSGLYAATSDGELFAFGTNTTNSTNSSAQFDTSRPVMEHPVEQYVPPNVRKAMRMGMGDD